MRKSKNRETLPPEILDEIREKEDKLKELKKTMRKMENRKIDFNLHWYENAQKQESVLKAEIRALERNRQQLSLFLPEPQQKNPSEYRTGL